MTYNNFQFNKLHISVENDPLIGTIWDLKYLIESFNKQDTISKTYIIKNIYTNEPLMLKIFNPDLLSINAKASEQFLLKAEKDIVVSHPNILQTKDFGIAEVKETETIPFFHRRGSF